LLQDLSARGLDSCLPTHLEAMRQLVFVSGLIKEVSLIGPTGQVLCTDTGSPFGRRDIVASAPVEAGEEAAAPTARRVVHMRQRRTAA
jgi:sensor c-di-GMP phosphodiesterase-like protein